MRDGRLRGGRASLGMGMKDEGFILDEGLRMKDEG